ncbi:MAG: PASTA domain-containing protein [Acidobacteria bacterium]|nr:PASTA domain-containing protein [Acidobacteriota bacterium]
MRRGLPGIVDGGGRRSRGRSRAGRPRPFAGRRAARGPGDDRSPRSRRARLILLVVGVAAGLLAIFGRCAHLQVIRAPELLDQARSQQEKTITLDPLRGPILDRNGKELAVSVDVDSVFGEPGGVSDPAAAARRLAPVVGLPASELRERLSTDRHFVWIKRKITPELRRRIEALRIEGVGFVRESRRYYPKRTLAAHLVGACGVDNQGLAGLEFMFDGAIRGTPGRMVALRDGRGGRVLDRERKEPAPGFGLSLTVDEVIQYDVERALDESMRETRAEGATVVVLRPQTGEILALASRPVFDPNAYSEARETARRNRATTDYYEPGSTFKVVTAAAALDAGKVHPKEVIWCENGSIVVARHRFKEDRLPYGNLTFTEVLAKSSNVGTIKVARRLLAEEFIGYIKGFGFGRKTGIDLPGESPGILREVSAWSGLSQASLAMGQEIGVTTLQLAAMMGTIANDGVWKRPRIVQALIPAPGGRAPAPPGWPGGAPSARASLGGADAPGGADAGGLPEPAVAAAPDRRRVIEARTARTLRSMLQMVTTDGTGKAASVAGYSVAGKTGTAQKIDSSGRYARGRYVSWFAGFVPAGTPALAIVVMIDEAKGPRFHGGDVAAPVFACIARAALLYLKVPPDHEEPLVFDRSLLAAAAPDGGRPERDRPAGAVHRIRRDGAAAAAVPALARAGGAVRASLAGGLPAAPERRAPRAATAMPDVVGLSLRQATEALAAAGLSCSHDRNGPNVIRQEPEPGAPVTPATPCAVIF